MQATLFTSKRAFLAIFLALSLTWAWAAALGQPAASAPAAKAEPAKAEPAKAEPAKKDAGAPAAPGAIKLTYANFPPAATFPCVQMERWKKEVEKRTQGKVIVETFPGSTLLGPKNTFDGVVSGVADIGNFAMSYQPGRFPVSEAIDLPNGFKNARVSSLTLLDLIEKYNPKEFEKVKILTLFTCPPVNLMTSKPVRSLSDLKGMELRVAGTGADVIKRLGGVPIAMPQSETPEAIQKGIVKGMASSLEVLKDFNYASYCPYATITDLQVVSFAVIMNKAKWESLSPEVKKTLDDLRREQCLWTGTYVDEHVKEGLAWSKQNHKHEVIELPAADKAAIPGLLKPMVEDYTKKTNAAGLPADQIIKDIQIFKAKYETEYK